MNNKNFERIAEGLKEVVEIAEGRAELARIHTPVVNAEPKPKQHRGFAAMSVEKRRAIAQKGGSMVPNHLRSFSRDSDLASRAGAKGGAAKKVVE